MAWVVMDGIPAALVHQYRLPDGIVGGSGKPDPKKVLVDGVMWELEPPKL